MKTKSKIPLTLKNISNIIKTILFALLCTQILGCKSTLERNYNYEITIEENGEIYTFESKFHCEFTLGRFPDEEPGWIPTDSRWIEGKLNTGLEIWAKPANIIYECPSKELEIQSVLIIQDIKNNQHFNKVEDDHTMYNGHMVNIIKSSLKPQKYQINLNSTPYRNLDPRRTDVDYYTIAMSNFSVDELSKIDYLQRAHLNGEIPILKDGINTYLGPDGHPLHAFLNIKDTALRLEQNEMHSLKSTNDEHWSYPNKEKSSIDFFEAKKYPAGEIFVRNKSDLRQITYFDSIIEIELKHDAGVLFFDKKRGNYVCFYIINEFTYSPVP